MPPTLTINDRIKIPLTELRFSYARSSGPGGQNVNKVNTKVTMRWRLADASGLPADVRQRLEAKYRRRINREGELIITSQRYRDQGRNVADCTEKLRAMVAEVATAPKPRKKSVPTRGSQARRLEDKRRQSKKKEGRGGNWSSEG